MLPLDMSPNYVGAIVGMASTAGNFIGFLAPYAAGVITDGQVREGKMFLYMVAQHLLYTGIG